MIQPPCYDAVTKTDCPKRHLGCRADCPEWKKYEQLCEERRAKRRLEYMSRVEPSEGCLKNYYRKIKRKRGYGDDSRFR